MTNEVGTRERARRLAARTREAYAGDLAILVRGTRLHPLRPARPDIDLYRKPAVRANRSRRPEGGERPPRYAAATVTRKLSALRAFYAYLVDRQLLPDSPAAGVQLARGFAANLAAVRSPTPHPGTARRRHRTGFSDRGDPVVRESGHAEGATA